MAINVPALKEKLRFLIRQGFFEDLEGIAAHFGKAKSTIQWWEHGDDDRAPNSISDDNEQALFDLIASCLPPTQDKAFIRYLAYASFDEFERAFLNVLEPTLRELINEEGRRESCELIRKSTAELLEFDDDNPGDIFHRVPASVFFRLEFRLQRSHRFIASLKFQNAAWTPLPIAFDGKNQRALVPGLKPDSKPRYMRETEAGEAMTIIVIQSASSLPRAIDVASKERAALDLFSLSSLASSFKTIPSTNRALYVADIKIEEV